MGKVPSENLLLMGKVVRPHGLGGWLKVSSYAQSEKSFLNCGTVWLESRAGEPDEYEVVSVTPHRNDLLMKLKDLDSIAQAEAYRGAAIYVRKEAVGPKGEEEYFWYELIGLRVYVNTGRYIGTIRHILPTGSNDIYVVGEGEEERLIPAIHGVVEAIDIPGRKMIVSEMEGLFDLNED